MSMYSMRGKKLELSLRGRTKLCALWLYIIVTSFLKFWEQSIKYMVRVVTNGLKQFPAKNSQIIQRSQIKFACIVMLNFFSSTGPYLTFCVWSFENYENFKFQTEQLPLSSC